jgi:rod shape determining protein RodA
MNNYSATQQRSKYLDWVTLSLYLSLLVIGWLMVFTVSYTDTDFDLFDISKLAGKQLMFSGLSLLLMFAVSVIDWKFWRTFSYIIYFFSLILLVLVLFLGSNIKGATAWFTFMGFSFQPVEVAKFGTALAIANYLSNRSIDLNQTKEFLKVISFLLAPISLIMLQPDAGSALVFLSFFILFYREGLSPVIYIVGALLAAVFVGALLFNLLAVISSLMMMAIFVMMLNRNHRNYWFIGFAMLFVANIISWIEGLEWVAVGINAVFLSVLIFLSGQKGEARMIVTVVPSLLICVFLAFVANFTFENILAPHQQERINVWLHPEKCDPRGSLYNLLQSKMAIGSGGLTGKGFMQGTLTKLNYVPEQSTDFIFCTIGEEHGFIGSLVIIGLYLGLLFRLIFIAERQRLTFVRNYAYAIAGILFVHFFINIGMTMGLVPVIGIPLPFLSYGGSSLLGFTLMLSVLLKLDTTRTIGN